MKMNLKKSVLLLLAIPFFAFSQIVTKNVAFPRGKSSTVLAGSVKGYASVDYVINAKAGQNLKVNLATNKGSNYFNILPPGSNDVAIYNSSNGGNSYSGVLDQSGNYKIRVYLMRSDARRNVTANYKLSIAITGAIASSKDAKVAGTDYNATGIIQSFYGDAGTKMETRFGVKRINNNHAIVHLMMPNKSERIVTFDRGEWKCTSPNCTINNFTRVNGDDWKLTINEMEVYIIPDAVITGG